MSNSNKVSVDNIEKEIMKYLQECKENIEDEVKDSLGVDYKNLDTLLYGMFDKERFLDIIKNFIYIISM